MLRVGGLRPDHPPLFSTGFQACPWQSPLKKVGLKYIYSVQGDKIQLETCGQIGQMDNNDPSLSGPCVKTLDSHPGIPDNGDATPLITVHVKIAWY